MLIRAAEIVDVASGATRLADIQIDGGIITRIGSLRPIAGDPVLDAGGCAVIPGLHDHHIHLLSYAASLNSLRCGPPDISTAKELAAVLERENSSAGWLRGYGYHQSVAGEIDCNWLDLVIPDRPVRIQHRSGRLWILNSAALAELSQPGGTLPVDGRIYDQDVMLRDRLGTHLPPIAKASQRLASYGVTGITDMTPSNNKQTHEMFCNLRQAGNLLQRVTLAGMPDLTFPLTHQGVSSGATKVHLHETDFPPFEDLRHLVQKSHESNRPVAVHCVTEAELVFAVAALREAGAHEADRIEHASVVPPELLEQLSDLAVTVVTQPNFVAERGDVYAQDIPRKEWSWLYRCQTLTEAGIAIAGGTDAPFGNADPWFAMQAAVTRNTDNGLTLGEVERLTPEQALALFTGEAEKPESPRQILEGCSADLCLLTRPWQQARNHLHRGLVATVICEGNPVFSRGVPG